MNKPSAKGWCPSTLIPMKSGDGLLIRIKPPFSRLTSRQAQTIAILSERYGNGFLDITNRANLQIRGLSQNTYPLMLKGLQNIGISGKMKCLTGSILCCALLYPTNQLAGAVLKCYMMPLATFLIYQ